MVSISKRCLPRLPSSCPGGPASNRPAPRKHSGTVAVIEWLPLNSGADALRRQNQVFADFANAIARMRRAEGLDAFFRECVKVVQEVSGFDRVMIYRFLPDGSGEIVAEHTTKRYRKKYLGLRFPASDIPSQARALYLVNKLRVLADVEASVDALVPPCCRAGNCSIKASACCAACLRYIWSISETWWTTWPDCWRNTGCRRRPWKSK